ncbi:MAG: alpha/beta fold hydrolase [bacterium]|nr:alpha/beta fold hydrolase [bacterium]
MLDDSGDVLAACVDEPRQPAPLPTVILIHGLSGSEESAYMCASSAFHRRRGHRVVRLNLRGAGPSRPSCREQYHAGRSEDLHDALVALPAVLSENGIVLVGYSLGGNMLLKFTAEHGAHFPIMAVATVSAPIDLAAASNRFLAHRNWIYHRHLLRNMKRECFGGPDAPSASECETIEACRTILEFDQRVVAPRNGFRDAAHYYEVNHARRFLAEIERPTLLVHALDDPWIPAEPYMTYSWRENPRLHPVLTNGGGHVGFHARGDRVPYHDRCIARFIERMLA